MIGRSLMAFFCLLLIVFIEDGFISAMPGALRFVPLTFVSGVLMYHFARPSIGCAWLMVGGLLLDLIGFPGPWHLVTYGLAGLIGLLLARKVFTNHSVYAIIGLGVSIWAVSVVVEDIWIALAQVFSLQPTPFALFVDLFWTRLLVFTVSLLLAFSLSRRTASFVRGQFFLRR